MPRGSLVSSLVTPLKLHRSYYQMARDGSPQWTAQFEHWITERTRAAVTDAQRQWMRWWDDPYVLGVLAKHFDADVLIAVVRSCQGDDTETIARDMDHSLHWVTASKKTVENYVRFALSPSHDKPTLPRHLA